MAVYASTPAYADGRRHPKALLLIVGAHAVLIAAVMTARMGVPIIPHDPPTVIKWIPIPPDPEPVPPPPQSKDPVQPPKSDPYIPPRPVPVPVPDGPTIDTSPVPQPPAFDPRIGTNPVPNPLPTPIPAVVRTGPRFVTPSDRIEPPYPADKQRLEEEATLRLRISIDERGRVVAVDPVGRADRSFLEAARRHLIANCRYKPGTEKGRADRS